MITSGLTEGGPEGEYTRKSEILDLKNGNSYCYDWASFAHNTEGSFGAFINDRVVVCGGEHPERNSFYQI